MSNTLPRNTWFTWREFNNYMRQNRISNTVDYSVKLMYQGKIALDPHTWDIAIWLLGEDKELTRCSKEEWFTSIGKLRERGIYNYGTPIVLNTILAIRMNIFDSIKSFSKTTAVPLDKDGKEIPYPEINELKPETRKSGLYLYIAPGQMEDGTINGRFL